MEIFKSKVVFNKQLLHELVFIEFESGGMNDYYFITDVSEEELRLVDRRGNGRKINYANLKGTLKSFSMKVIDNDVEVNENQEENDKYKDVVYKTRDIIDKEFAYGVVSTVQHEIVNNENKVSEIRRLLNNNSISSQRG